MNKGTVYPPATRGLNFFEHDENLRRFLARRYPALLKSHGQALSSFGAWCGDALDESAAYSDRIHPPVFKQAVADPIRPDIRRGQVYLNPAYEEAQQHLYRSRMLADCFKSRNAAPQALPFIAQYLTCHSDIATGCPFAMTHPVALLLARHAPDDVRRRFLPEILRTDGMTPIGGTWATEKHSGSDIGGTKTRAIAQDDGTWRLHGDNWFTSAIGFRRFLTIKTARPDGAPAGSKGLGLYLVASHIDEDWTVPNAYEVVHLKEKLGTRALPTGEVRLDGTVCWQLAPAGQGLKMMMEALGCSRVHNAMAAAGVMHRAYLEAMCWATHRAPFGKPLAEQPMVQKRILDIHTEWLAGSALAFEAVRCFDAKDSSWMRIATALAKFKTAEQAVWCTQKALALVGGNGYTEEYPSARQYRDAMVLPVWEGPEQIQALELMRMLAQPGAAAGFIHRVTAIAHALPKAAMQPEKDNLLALGTDMQQAFKALQNSPAIAEQAADEYLHKMSDTLAYALLCEEGAWELAHCRDMQKILTAREYYRRTWMHHLGPMTAPSPLQKAFADITGNRPLTPGTGRTAPSI